MLDLLKNLWKSPKHRKIIILIGLISVLIILAIIQLMRREVPPPEGSMRVVICPKCKTEYVTRIKDINDENDKRNKCKKCGNKLTFAWKCDECQFEYPELDLQAVVKKMGKTMDKFQAIVESRRCPNCGSLATHPISVNEFNGVKKKKIKRPEMKLIKQ